MNFQRKRVAAALACVLGATGTAAVTEALAQAPDIRVDVTGSSIRRVEAEGALPVTIVSKDDIARIGATNTEQLLQSVSAISTMEATQLATGAGLSTYGEANISLRGLGPQRTLILVNGRRLAPFAGSATGSTVNVNSIPIAAIERIEVLRDGASAVYGADAIAGVVNFILTKDYTGAEVGGTYGQSTRSGGGENTEVHAVAGWGNLDKDRFNVTVSASYQKEDALYAKDRNFAKTGNVYPWLVSGATGQGNIQGAYIPGNGQPFTPEQEATRAVPGFGNPGTSYGNPLAATNQCEAVNQFLNPTPTGAGGGKPGGYPYCAFDSSAFLNLLPEREAYNFSGNFAFNLTKDIQFFADGLYSKQTVTNIIQPSPLRRDFMQSDQAFYDRGIDPALLIFPNNPNYQLAANYLNSIGQGSIVGQPLAITSRVFDFGLRGTEDEAEQWRAVAGLRGNWMKQDWEVAYTHNENKVEGKTISGYFSQAEYAKVLNSSNVWNPWSLTQDPALVSALAAANYVGPTLNAKAKSDSFDSKISGDVLQLPAGAMSYAMGYQWRKEQIDLQPSPALGSGDIAGLGGATPPMNKDRTVNAIFGEVLIPIIKDLEGNAAIRYDDYNDVGATTNYFVNLRWQPVRQLLLRTAYGTGFRAPTLLDLYQPQVFGTTEQFQDPLTGQANLQVNAFSGGNPNLKPETSEQWSVGFVWQPVRQFSFGVDWWQVKLEDIISTPSAQEVVSGFRNGDPTYANSVRLTSSGDIADIDTFIVNAGKAKVEGYDVNSTYRDSFPWGEVGLNFSGTYIDKFNQTSPGGVEHHKVATLVADAEGNPVIGAADFGGVVLRWKHVLTATYGYRDWAFSLTQNYYSGYETGHRQLDDERNFIGGQSIFDLQIAYTGIKNLRLALGVKNLFDRDPPIYVPVSNQFQAGYDVSLYDPRARFIYGSVNWKFW
jgi:iron complex outermembrane receptor protein